MSDRCPTCGQPLRVPPRFIANAGDLLHEMSTRTDEDERPIDVYLSVNGTWHLTRTANCQISPVAIRELLNRGAIRRTYSDCDECYTTGPTLDVAATLEARRIHGKKAEKVYLP